MDNAGKLVFEKVSFKESFVLNLRCFKLWWSEYPRIIISRAADRIFSALTPYAGLFITARLINEIAGERNRDVLIFWVMAALISAAVLGFAAAVIRKWRNYHSSVENYARDKFHTDKHLSLDFRDADSDGIQDTISQIRGYDRRGFGAANALHSFDGIVFGVFSVIGAIMLTVTMFTAQVPETAGWLVLLNNPLFTAVIAVLFLCITFIRPIIQNKAHSYMALLDSDTVDGTRYVNFFSSTAHQPDRALDIRMYRQDVMYDKYIRHGDNVAVGTKSKLARLAKTRVGGLNVLSAVISESFTALLFAFVGLKAWGGAFGVGSVTQYVGAVALMSVGIAEFVKFGGAVINNASALKVFFAFLDMPNAMFQGSLTTEKRSDHKYEIEFRNVSFKYNSASVYALKNISLKFEIGKRLAIVGQNGSGKTTFIKLLCRLYDPTEGEILLNGIDIRKYDYLQYMAIYAVVFQDFRLLSAALGQNVAAAASFDGAQAADCLEKAGFGERLKTMPDGLDTLLFKDLGGIDVSGGESQKIALARALYKSAHFAVLDEPTAALDPVAEFEVYTKMNEIVGEKTAVFISHRLSSCRFCSDIAVFHEGVLTQRGNHETLIADAGGKYYELWNAQAQYYTE